MNFNFPLGSRIINEVSKVLVFSLPFEFRFLEIKENGKLLGYVSLEKPMKIKSEEFNKYFNEHKISFLDKEKLWDNVKYFYLYKVRKVYK